MSQSLWFAVARVSVDYRQCCWKYWFACHWVCGRTSGRMFLLANPQQCHLCSTKQPIVNVKRRTCLSIANFFFQSLPSGWFRNIHWCSILPTVSGEQWGICKMTSISVAAGELFVAKSPFSVRQMLNILFLVSVAGIPSLKELPVK